MQAVRRAVSQWPLWDLPRSLQVLVVCVVSVYCGAICASLAATPVQAGQLRLFGVLLACSVAAVELTRRTGEPDGAARDVYAIWDLPTAVLLPPLYALLAPIPRMALAHVRVRQALLHRCAYTAAAVGLAYAAASAAFHHVAPVLGHDAGTGAGEAAMLWTVLAAGCGLLGLVINAGLVLVTARDSAPGKRLLPGIAGAEAMDGSIAELSLGTLAAFAAMHATLAIVYAMPLVIPLHRSLRHARLLSEARTDGKTGLLNDKAWRREAESEVARAARTRSPIAVGILDIDHFKAVNDTYGHPAGDAVLAAVATALTALLRPYDLIGRVGGEEFAFLLPNSPAREAIEVAERLREKIPLALLREDHNGSTGPRVTVSVGVATADQPTSDLGWYYRLADQALYAAKEHGRNAVWVATGDQAGDPVPVPGDAVRVPASRNAADAADGS
jgi:diguanylate cyclase (GGDEF)-like protein